MTALYDKIQRRMRIAGKIGQARWFKRYIPLSVSFALTRRCNLNCVYCGMADPAKKELTTREILSIIDQLAAMGTEQISFTGGEPLLRSDLPEIVDHAYNKGIMVGVNTNGTLLDAVWVRRLAKSAMIAISIDGPEVANAQARGSGAYQKILESIALCKAAGMNVRLSVVLSAYNLEYIDDILDSARQCDVKVVFQPASVNKLGHHDKNPGAADPEAYKKALQLLIDKKKQGDPVVFSSVVGLRHLQQWPKPTSIPCWAGRLHCRIDCDGEMFPCARSGARSVNCRDEGVKAAFAQMTTASCSQCWCATMVDFNYLASMDVRVIANFLRMLSS